MASPVKETAWLDWIATLMGEASRQTCAATFPPNRFYCLLDELPLHLIPRGFHPVRPLNPQQPLFLNSECSIGSASQPPPLVSELKDLLAGFAVQGTVAWVNDPPTGSVLPFWLGPRLEGVVRNLQPEKPAPPGIAKEDLALLVSAGILMLPDRGIHRQREWDDTVARSTPAFQEKGYVPLRGLIHPFHVAALRRYYRHLIRRDAIQLGDEQCPRRYVAHNEPVARFFHYQLTKIVSAVAGQPVKPSYVYLASYLGGSELKKHSDRAQCEFSVTLALDFSPEPRLETPWPIRLETLRGTTTVYQALGDGLAYRGTRVPHFRDALPEGQTSTSIFFHYVPSDFSGSLN